jgi:hypothetical protein
MKRILSLLCLLWLGSLVGCSPYVDDFDYRPHPAVAEVHSSAQSQSPAAVAMGTVIGVHVADKKLDIPESVEIRLRLENNGPEPLSFDPATMEMTSAHLQPFAPPIIHAPGTITLNSNEAATLTVFFPLPAHSEAGDLESLTLRWIIQIGAQKLTQRVTFQRIYPRVYYDDPYWRPYYGYPPYFWYGGVVVIHRR